MHFVCAFLYNVLSRDGNQFQTQHSSIDEISRLLLEVCSRLSRHTR